MQSIVAHYFRFVDSAGPLCVAKNKWHLLLKWFVLAADSQSPLNHKYSTAVLVQSLLTSPCLRHVCIKLSVQGTMHVGDVFSYISAEVTAEKREAQLSGEDWLKMSLQV